MMATMIESIMDTSKNFRMNRRTCVLLAIGVGSYQLSVGVASGI